MRDIEFRGKCFKDYFDLKYGDWVFGGIVHQTDFYGDPVDRYYIIDGTVTQDYDIGPEVRVDNESVGQYIVRKDRNGKKIYEGDILKGEEYPFCYNGEYNYYGEVRWFDEEGQFGVWIYKKPGANVIGRSTGNVRYLDEWDQKLWEVIGNVYDNPELTFEGGKE